MDDLAGLSWTSSSGQKQEPNKPTGTQGNYFPTMRPTPPLSGRSTPSLVPQQSAPSRSNITTPNPGSKSSTPAPDSFANLLPQFSAPSKNNLSLQEQQRALQEQKLKQATARSKQWDTDISALESFGSGRSGTPASGVQTPGAFAGGLMGASKTEETEEDILAAFGKEAPVDNSSHFPVPGGSRSGSTVPTVLRQQTPATAPSKMEFPDDDDDPFGLGSVAGKPSGDMISRALVPEPDDDDDVLGLLGKPVSELPPPKPPTPEPAPVMQKSEHPQDKAVAELVDMGFPPEKAREALEATDSGVDVQAAVGWILNQAHATSRNKNQSANGDQRSTSRPGSSRPPQDRLGAAPRRDDSRSPANGERDAAKMAQELGNNFFKTANSLWKTGQKKINKAVADFNTDGDSSQPKWMRDAMAQEQAAVRRPKPPVESDVAPSKRKPESDLLNMTDEAAMLESGPGRPQPRQKQQQTQPEHRAPSSSSSSRTQSPFAQPKFTQEPISRSRMRQTLEEESAQAYVSPARRKKATPKPPSPEPDLFFSDSAKPPASTSSKPAPTSSRPTPRTQPQPQSRPKPSTPIPSRPKAPPRNIPTLSSIVLQSSTQHRLAGNAAFKLGNYSDAGTSYSSSLRDLPPTHPLTILLLTNRALTHLKTGDPKASIADADSALALIGPARGEGESINTGPSEGVKDMQPFWAKAMMRRAEALEQLERWADAARVWKTCVEAGVGGAQAIQARERCERTANPVAKRPTQRPAAPLQRKSTPAAPARRTVSALDDLSGRPASVAGDGTNSEAVQRMRKANADAEKADEERFRLSDSVDARLVAWRKGKEGNLRALLGSLDTVLWEGSGWKKVGMGDLIIPGKVKIAYMKGIGKVHPDKLSQSATTEQVMISQAVFSTLNEAWDKFKAENGL